MNERGKKLLFHIVSEYIKTANPVGSKAIAEHLRFNVSPATIRNEMVELEAEGYIYQPHTSAGRVPTEKGYQFYIKNFLDDGVLSKKKQAALELTLKDTESFDAQAFKLLARQIAELAQLAVFIGFSIDDFYYTGLSNLLNQPEFAQHQTIYNLSKIIDHFDQVVTILQRQLTEDITILIGSQNPFGNNCAAVIMTYNGPAEKGLLGIIGPARMDYQTNVRLLKYTQQLINEIL